MSREFTHASVSAGIYPEREEPRMGRIERLGSLLRGRAASWLGPKVDAFKDIPGLVHGETPDVKNMTGKVLRHAVDDLRVKLRRHGFQKDLVARAFAMVRESARRELAMAHVDVQMIGGLAMLRGMVAEMETGEGKTLTATLPACTLAFAGIPVHIITVNDYLAARDAEWMGPIYKALGLSVGTIVHGKSPAARREAYRSDVTYCTNKEAAFDYLRDRLLLWDRPSGMRLQMESLYGDHSRVNRLTMRGLHFAIVDEADSVLIDEARVPLIISSEAGGAYPPEVYREAVGSAMEMSGGDEFLIQQAQRNVEITEKGRARIQGRAWPDLGVSISLEQKEELIRKALVALHLFRKDKQYLIKSGKIQIVDEYTGRLMADRSWERGLHQLIEIKEGCRPSLIKETRARLSYQKFFRRYQGLAGMTGTAREVAGELWSIYRLRVVSIPTNRAMKRRILPDLFYATTKQKWEGVVRSVAQMHEKGRPVLVGTRSVEASERLSRLLNEVDLPHRVLNARQDKEEAEIIAQAGQKGRITVATNMAGRGTDIKLGQGMAEIGGLHVIASERHESGRIDRQLFGRCARQGDPGTCQALVCLEDELVTAHLGGTLQRVAGAVIGSPSGLRWIGGFLIRKAQGNAERLHAGARQNLLRMDEQIGESLAFAGRPE
ncbi:MAG: prepilin peptidase [Desulfobacteraceae bacterium]|nr:MAG: prepilin peptidase [Desulfobacteraceae bacterium]